MASAGPGRVRVLIYAAAPADDPAGVTSAYHAISERLRGTPGLLGNELLHAVGDDGSFVVMSEWVSLAAFRAWEQGAEHRDDTSPLRRFQRPPHPRPFGIYEVTAAY